MELLKQIDYSKSSFVANGVTYLVRDSLSIERYKYFEKYQITFGFARDFKSVYESLDKSIDFANKGKGVDAWNIIFNLREQLKDLDKRAHSAMFICALFIVTEDEDLTKWDEHTAEVKISNWNEEGYDQNCFFRLAANLVPGYLENLESIFQPISELAAAAEMIKQQELSSNNTSI